MTRPFRCGRATHTSPLPGSRRTTPSSRGDPAARLVALSSPHVQNAHMAIEADRLRLARDGGPPARTRPEAPMFPGGMEVGEEELEALTRVIRGKNLFRYYGVGDGPQEVELFEQEVA